MASEQRGYRSYLLRLWQAGNGEAPEWRITIEDVRTHTRQSFASADQLAGYAHLNFLGRYHFSLAEPIARGERRLLRKPDESSIDAAAA